MEIDEPAIRRIAEDGREDLPPEFFRYYDTVGDALERGLSPIALGVRAQDEEGWYRRIGPAICEELRSLLCTNDSKYDSVRESGGAIGQTAVAAIAAHLAVALGLPVTIVAASTAFVILLVSRVSIESFCKVTRDK